MDKRLNIILFISIVLVFFGVNCNSQPKLENRQPYAAGRFYPSDEKELKSLLGECFNRAVKKKQSGEVLAIISPHAGYVFSGVVAASAFNQIDPGKEYENIFILGSSHSTMLKGASIYNVGNYITPLGEAKVNIELATKLIEKNDLFEFNKSADANEHSIEVQIPFLQYVMKKDFAIVPIVIGAYNLTTSQKIADALNPYFNERNLFVISTDFSHYPDYDVAKIVDKETADAIQTNSVEDLLKVLTTHEQQGIKNLSTSMCGWPAVFALLFMTQNYPELSITDIQYMNSGDVSFGDKTRVVGYHGMSVSLKKSSQDKLASFNLNTKDKLDLLRIARNTIEKYLTKSQIPEVEIEELSPGLMLACGAFVTLHEYGQLRGCIGRFISNDPLYKVVQQMSIASATQDYRFQRVSPDEVDKLEIEISVLSPLKKINSIDEFELGKHGIYIIKGSRSGTFLPQVAEETEWTKEEFLGHCAQDKAGIGWDGWKDADLYIYEALVFSEKELGLK